MKFKRILVAIDLSPIATAVFNQALELAKQEKATLKLFHCLSWRALEQETVLMVGTQASYTAALGDELQRRRQKRLQEETQHTRTWLQNCCRKAAEQGVSAEFDYNVGAPGPLICGAAGNWGADLIVLGRRGLQGLTEVWLGSVSNHVVHHAPCSVLVVQGNSSSQS